MKLNDNKIVFGLETLKFWPNESLCFYSMQNWPKFQKSSFLRWKYVKTVIWLTIYNVHINKDFGIVTSWFVVYLQGERCSFPVQMWNYHMRGLCHDLWTICSPRLSQDIYSQILHNSLQIFSQRYSHSKPSYRRTSQYRLVIHVYEKLMLPVFRNILDIHVTIIHYEWRNTLQEEAFSAKKNILNALHFPMKFLKKFYRPNTCHWFIHMNLLIVRAIAGLTSSLSCCVPVNCFFQHAVLFPCTWTQGHLSCLITAYTTSAQFSWQTWL